MRRKIEENVMLSLMILSLSIIVISFSSLIASILIKGIPAMNLDMITKTPEGGFYMGKGGGILNAIIGSLLLAGGATIIAAAVGFPIVFYINFYLNRKSNLSNFIRLILDILWGIPSIVYGAFGFIVMAAFNFKTSLLAGIIVVSFFIIPIIVRSLDEVINTIPKGLFEAAISLGATKFEICFKVVIRQILPGFFTAILIAFGRAIGDAAAVMFTTGFTDNIPKSLLDSAATLPLTIFFQLSVPIKEVQDRAYSSALILTIIILTISIISRILAKKLDKYRIH